MKDDRVYLEDTRRHHFCMSGSRLFAKKHGLDMNDFVKNGISFDALLRTESPAARRIVALVKRDRLGRN